MAVKASVVFFVIVALAGASALADDGSRAPIAAATPPCSQSCDLAAHKAAMAQAVSTTGMVADDMPPMTGMSGMASPPPAEGAHAPGNAANANGAMSAMSEQAMKGHMTMTPSRPQSAADRERAHAILGALRTSLAPYKDYRAAEAAGYKPFHPEWPLPMYHFVNYQNAVANALSFDPGRPTALMYKRVAGGYELEGAMYTAPRSSTLDQLDARVPLSVATWHEHTNLCIPPAGSNGQAFGPNARFGLQGSITTADACAQAGGTFIPVIYNWMVHVWPYETDPSKVWASADDPGSMGH